MIHETGWLKRGGESRTVVWTTWHNKDGHGEQWGTMCLPCKLAWYQADDSNHTVIVYDARATSVRAVGSREDPGVHVWMGPGCTASPKRVADVLSSFVALERARSASTRIPEAKWEVEIRDGEPWAPWDPGSGVYKRGHALQLRKSTLRKSKRERKCQQCRVVLDDGSTAWVPMERERVTGDGGIATFKKGKLMLTWDHGGIQKVKVCSACVAGARVVEADDPGDMVGHLRVMTGGAS